MKSEKKHKFPTLPRKRRRLEEITGGFFRQFSPFFWVGLLWLAVVLWAGLRFSADGGLLGGLLWAFGIWLLCILDLLCWAQLGSKLIGYLGAPEDAPEKRAAFAIQAFYWGSVKLACLGIFTVVFLKGRTLPSQILLLGLATLAVVPIGGGLLWSRRLR